jgi:hypothetical protein
MSALPPKAAAIAVDRRVRFGPEADIPAVLLALRSLRVQVCVLFPEHALPMSSDQDMNGYYRWKDETRGVVDVADPATQCVRSGIVEPERGDDEHDIQCHHRYAGEPVEPAAPGALNMDGNERAQSVSIAVPPWIVSILEKGLDIGTFS